MSQLFPVLVVADTHNTEALVTRRVFANHVPRRVGVAGKRIAVRAVGLAARAIPVQITTVNATSVNRNVAF